MIGEQSPHHDAALESFGRSLLPTMVRFRPICTLTGVPPTLTVALLLMFQPSEPVENSLTSAIMGMPLMVTSTGLAFSWKCLRVMGHGLAMFRSLKKQVNPVAQHHIM